MASSTPRPSLSTVGSSPGDRCPWCDQPVTHAKYSEIRTRIAAEERERSAQAERELNTRMALERSRILTQARAEVEKAKSDATLAIKEARRDVATQTANARAEGVKSGQAELNLKLTEVEKARTAAERQLRDVKTGQAAEIAKRVAEARSALDKDYAAVLKADKSAAFKEQLKLQATVEKLRRQLERKTADELGEGGEVDLFETLKSEFPDDRITRVNKGAAGADIIHKVVHNGRVAGQIVYDSKNRSAWRTMYVTKLHQDQLAAEADHAILATQILPAGTRQVHMQGGVIVANPARVLALVQLLRRHILQLDAARISSVERAQKVTRLYDFITSDKCARILEEMDALTDGILEIDVAEKRAHDLTWERRGEKARALVRAHATLVSEIEQIIGTAESQKSA